MGVQVTQTNEWSSVVPSNLTDCTLRGNSDVRVCTGACMHVTSKAGTFVFGLCSMLYFCAVGHHGCVLHSCRLTLAVLHVPAARISKPQKVYNPGLPVPVCLDVVIFGVVLPHVLWHI